MSLKSDSSHLSKHMLVYDIWKNATYDMKRTTFEKQYKDTPPECISTVRLPKGVSDIDLSSDDFHGRVSPEPADDSNSYGSSVRANITIPTKVFIHRLFNPSAYPEVTIVRKSPSNSPTSSRSNTENERTHPKPV